MKKLLFKTFGIRDVELRISFLMQLYIFLVITVLLIVKPTVNALFVSQLGADSLPFGYLLVALIAVISSYFYSKAIREFSFIKVTIVSLISFSIVFSLLAALLYFNLLNKETLYFYYVFVALFAVIATSQFWIFANMVFNAREAKRIFGFIGAGAIAGGIFGGYLTSFIAKHFGTSIAIILAAIFILCCIPILKVVYNSRIQNLSIFKRKQIIDDKNTVESSTVKLILQSKHLTYIALITGISVIVAKLVDFQFSDFANKVISNSNDLASFFGFWFSTFNVGALLIQFFATRFILSRFGVGLSLLLLPISVALSVVCLIIAPELLLAAIAMKMADGSFKQSINKSAIELLVLPISVAVKNQTKTFIDVFVDSLAAGFSGLLLIFVIKGLDLSGVAISALILIFTFIWILLVTNVRQEYLLSFKRKIINNLGKPAFANKRIRKAAVINDLMKRLVHGSKNEKISALQKIKYFKSKKYNNIVFNLLKSEEAEIRAEAFQYLSHYKELRIYHQAEKLTEDSSIKVRMSAIAYLIEHTPVKEMAIVLKQLNHPNAEISGMALVNLSKQIQYNPILKKKYQLKNRIHRYIVSIGKTTNGSERQMKKIFAIQAIGHANIPDLFPDLQKYFFDKKTIIVRQAIQAAGRTNDQFFIKDLIQFSTKTTYARMAKEALKMYKNKLIPAFKGFLKEEPQDLRTIRLLPSIVKQINKPKAINFLFKLLEHPDTVVRQNALKGLSDLHHNFPKLKFRKKRVVLEIVEEILRFQETLLLLHVQSAPHPTDQSYIIPVRKRLVALLKKQFNAQLDNIFFLLSLRYSKDNISAIHKGIKSSKMRLRNTALDFLDNLLESRLKSILIPLLEMGVVNGSKRKKISKLKLAIPDDYACLQAILESGRDVRLKIAALHLITKLNQPEHQVLIRIAAESGDPELALFAKQILVDYSESSTG